MDTTSLAQPKREAREMREWRSCYGSVVVDTEYGYASGELMQVVGDCPFCKGAGQVSAYRYLNVRRSR